MILGNTIENYLLFIGFSLGITILYVGSKRLLHERIDDSLILEALFSLKTPVHLFLAFYLGSFFLSLEGAVGNVLHNLAIIVVAYQLIVSTKDLEASYIKKRSLEELPEQERDVLQAVRNGISVILLLLAGIFVLSNLGFNVSALLTGLGIGGVAVAVASQNILRDLFSYMSILIDKPVKAGDNIRIGEITGRVTHVGIQTTRLKAPGGETIVISNEQITNTEIKNFNGLRRRRKDFVVPLSPSTNPKKLIDLPEKVSELFSSVEKTTFHRCFVKRIDDTSIDLHITYWITPWSYQVYSETHHKVNVLLLALFKKEKIVLAPIQKLFQTDGSFIY